MRKGWWSRIGLATALGLTIAGSGLSAGCASEAEPISQVQVNYVRKTDLVGTDPKNPTEWYMRMTVVDVARTNHFAFPGLQDELRRVRWEFQENFLIARRAYELVAGSDGKGADPSKNDGVIVAIYPIQSHFDVRRQYNPATGEELGVIVENTVDRPWYERDFVRIDWSRNLASDPDFMNLWIYEIFGEIKWQQVQYFDLDPKSPNAPIFDAKNGYMDITSKWFAETESWQFDWGKLPVCYIYNLYTGSDVTDCNSQEVAVRTSFMKVGERDFEPTETNSEKFSLFGTFNRDRYGFSRQYEILDQHWHRLMAKHNLWKKSHDARSCFVEQKGDRAEADKFCGSVAGSVCDPYAAKCTVPMKDRAVRTIPYHVSKSMPADLWPENQTLINEWNDALRGAVAAAREAECTRFKMGDAKTCHSNYFDGETPKVPEVAVALCHNPVIQGDNEACGKVGTSAREGDLRYNLIGWVDMPLSAAPLGYGPDGADPLTGEVIQATAYMYGASVDNYATMARDLVRVAIGDIQPDKFVDGTHIAEGLGQFTSPSGKEGISAPLGEYLSGKMRQSAPSGMSAAEIEKRVGGLEPAAFVNTLGAAAVVTDKASPTAKLAAVQSLIATKGLKGDKGFGGRAEAEASLKAKADLLAGSKSESLVIDSRDYLFANGIAAASDETSAKEISKLSSPFAKLGPFAAAQMQDKIFSTLEKQGVCMFGMNEFNAPHLEGLAKKYIAQFKDLTPEARSLELFKVMRKAIYRAVTEHEVGHTMGLRHNFQGSWDSMNFHPNYWKLRTNDGKATAACAGPRTDPKSDTCMGPRYLDPESNEEQGAGASAHPSIEEYAYSSIMDYGYDFNTDLVGLGSYDKAAMKFIYGNSVEVLPSTSAVAKQIAPIHSNPINEQWLVKRTDGVMGGGDVVQPTHYTTLARVLQNEKLLFDPARCREAKTDYELHAAIDGKVCEPLGKEHAHVADLVSGELTGIDAKYSAPLWKTNSASGGPDRIRWPYRFGTDEYASHPHNLRFDAGADIYEAAENLAKLYEYRYVLDYFRRGRRGWLTWSMGQRVWGRYFSRMQSIGWLATSKLTQYAAMYPNKKPTENLAISSDDWGRGYSLALTAMFESIEKAILRPQPGGYGPKEKLEGQKEDLYEVPDWPPNSGKDFNVSLLEGRYIDDDLNNKVGGSFHYHSYHERLGVYAEKPIAVAALSAQFPPIHVFSRDTYVDGRNMLLNFRTLMPTAYDRLMGSIMSFDTDAIAPFVDKSKKDATGNSPVFYPKLWEQDYKVLGTPGVSDPVLVDPLMGFRLQVPALMYTMWFGLEDGQMGLWNSMRVWVEGGPEALPLKDTEKAYLYEPDSGQLWAARNMGTQIDNGLVRPAGIGNRMVMHANQLLAGGYKVQVGTDGMPVYDPVTHEPKWEVGAKVGEVRDASKAQQFRRYIGIFNVLRQYTYDLRGVLH
jgi:hypothetical protein